MRQQQMQRSSNNVHKPLNCEHLHIYDLILTSIEIAKEPKVIELQHIQQGDVGLFGIKGRKSRSLFVVIDRANDNHLFYVRECWKGDCVTRQRKLSYHKKGFGDTVYLEGFVGNVEVFLGDIIV
jgi:hypothetical protein